MKDIPWTHHIQKLEKKNRRFRKCSFCWTFGTLKFKGYINLQEMKRKMRINLLYDYTKHIRKYCTKCAKKYGWKEK